MFKKLCSKVLDALRGHKQSDQKDEAAKRLYAQVMKAGPYDEFMESSNLGEDMQVINHMHGQFWKPRYLLNHETKCAYEIMDSGCKLSFLTPDDIDWDSLRHLDNSCIIRARDLDAIYPTFVCKFKDGVAFVDWQLNPDGRYYMDEDGFGMTDDEEVEIHGCIDRQCRCVAKFRVVNATSEYAEMHQAALRSLAALR